MAALLGVVGEEIGRGEGIGPGVGGGDGRGGGGCGCSRGAWRGLAGAVEEVVAEDADAGGDTEASEAGEGAFGAFAAVLLLLPGDDGRCEGSAGSGI